MVASCKLRGKNKNSGIVCNEGTVPSGTSVFCGSIFAAWNQCSDEDGKIEAVIQKFSYGII